ncbi:TOBE domain-containing protein [Roseivirga sp.]|uniref:TOBE domain-containing protein n=1 Tax=Roseivirga sp. TaxID=1964215 RepID=UPI003B8B1C3E
MNTLAAEISSIQTQGSLSIVKLRIAEEELTSIVIDTPETSDFLNKDYPVNALFKETEVIIGLSESPELSIENSLKGTISDITSDELLIRVVIQIETDTISSIVSTASVKKLQLTIGKTVYAMIKSNEIMLAAI